MWILHFQETRVYGIDDHGPFLTENNHGSPFLTENDGIVVPPLFQLPEDICRDILRICTDSSHDVNGIEMYLQVKQVLMGRLN